MVPSAAMTTNGFAVMSMIMRKASGGRSPAPAVIGGCIDSVVMLVADRASRRLIVRALGFMPRATRGVRVYCGFDSDAFCTTVDPPDRRAVSVGRMSEERPLWRQGFDAVERVVGPPLA